MAGELKTGAFVIRKIHSAYLVSVIEFYVTVKPLHSREWVAACIIIASTMQTVGNSKLMLYRPADPCQFLMDYYKDLGWDIEVAD